MSQANFKVPTQRVKLRAAEGQEVVINKDDFDPELHETIEERKKLVKKDEEDVKSAKK